MEASGHAAVARELWRATSEADPDSIRGVLAPDVVWRTFSSGALTGPICGPDAVLDLFARTGELVDQLSSELIDIFSGPRGAVLHYRVRAERGLRRLDSQVLLMLHISQGKVVEVSAVPLDARPYDSFWMSH